MLDFGDLYEEKEDCLIVIKDLSHPCYDCRLGHFQNPKHNRGLVWRGNSNAKIAIVSIMPGPKEMEGGKPLIGGSGKLCDKWFGYIHIDTNKDAFVINVVQCKPPDVKKSGEEKASQREPELDEYAACFPSRCLRVLRAMPHLEVIVTLGWSAARCLLGGEPKEASHMGHWYTTSLLPDKAVYCLPHPAGLLRDEAGENKASDAILNKKYKVIKCLDRFKRQYLDTGRAVGLASDPHNIAR